MALKIIWTRNAIEHLEDILNYWEVRNGTSYINPAGYLFLDQKSKLGIVKRIQKQIDKFALTNADLGFATN